MSNSSDADLLSIFWVEVSEYLEALNNALLQVEMASPEEAPVLLREMNRVAHSMKGAARAVGISLIETISHYMEEVFSAAQHNKIQLSPEVADTLYDGLDLIQNIMDGQENHEDALTEVLAALERIVVAQSQTSADHSNGEGRGEEKEDKRRSASEVQVQHIIRETPVVELPAMRTSALKPPDMLDSQTVVVRPAEETIRVTVSKLDKLMAEASELLIVKMHGEERSRRVHSLLRRYARWQREWRNVRASYIRIVRRMQDYDDELSVELSILFKFLEANQRYLTDTLREISQLTQLLVQANTQIGGLADQLQDDIGAMRMMPFESIMGGYQRMVRDLARDTGKHVILELEGASVEIDKTVLEALKDPIMHILRNAVDHGIESPQERERMGKPPTGRIDVIVEQRGSEIVVSVTDDGAGIDPAKIRRSVVKHGLLTEQEAAQISDEDIKSYIFYSGLTTSEQVTALSGRGVGMDIVRERVEGMRGRVSVQSAVGSGTTINLSVPVSLTRIRCIILELGDEAYAVPSAMVVRMDTLDRDEVFTAEGRDMILINDRPTPLVSLGAILDVPRIDTSEPQDAVPVLVLSGADRVVAFEVDFLSSERELVLKPLGREMERAPYVAGAALLGSGDVIIVLDANALVRKASGAALPRRRTSIYTPTPVERRLSVLVVDDSITTRTLEKNILETAGFEVHVAMDGMEAWSLLAELQVDVVISDVEMPNMNGLELTRRIKEHDQTRHIPVVLLTSLGKPEQREAGLRAGADAYLVKSRFDQGELLQTIQAVI